MLDWLKLGDPLVGGIVLAAAGLVLLIVVASIWRRWRENAADARRRKELRHTYDQVQLRKLERRRLAERVIATSSTGSIAGFVLVRQIEAVFAEGQRSPAEAVEVLKALAAQKGGNALINLASQRLASGKCVASGDAVIVRPEELPAAESERKGADAE